MGLRFDFLADTYGMFLEGAGTTILLALVTVIFGVLLGLLIALMRLSKIKILKWIAIGYTELIRGTPLMVQIVIIYYGIIPNISGLGNIIEFASGCLALSINSSAYVAEIIRSGIQSVDPGQMEAARSLGMKQSLAMKSIIIPQAIKNILPALGNEFVVVIKESAIVYLIGNVNDLMYQAKTIAGAKFLPIEPYLVAALLYFIMTFTISKLLGLAEGRLRKSER